MIGLDIFHDSLVIFLVGLWGPVVLEEDASVDLAQKLTNVVDPGGSTPGDSVHVFQNQLMKASIQLVEQDVICLSCGCVVYLAHTLDGGILILCGVVRHK